MRWSLGSTKQITKVHHLLQDSTCSALNDWPRIPFSKNQIIITIKTCFFIFLMLKFVPQNIRKENILIDFLFLAIPQKTTDADCILAIFISFGHFLQSHQTRHFHIIFRLHLGLQIFTGLFTFQFDNISFMLIFSSTFMFSFTF